MKSFYSVLGVAKDAEAEVITAAYKAMMRKYHPDTNSSADASLKAQAINEAYDTLRDPLKRSAHDRALAAAAISQARSSQSSPPPPPPPPPAEQDQPKADQQALKGRTKAAIALSVLFFIGLIWNANAQRAERDSVSLANAEATIDSMAAAAEANMHSDSPTEPFEEWPGPSDAYPKLDIESLNKPAVNPTKLKHVLAAEANAQAQSDPRHDPFDLGAMSPDYHRSRTQADPLYPSRAAIEGKAKIAITTFARIYAHERLSGAKGFSQSCAESIPLEDDIVKVDFCVAFDESARLLDAAFNSQTPGLADEYFIRRSTEHLLTSYRRFGIKPARRFEVIRSLVREELPARMEEALDSVDM